MMLNMENCLLYTSNLLTGANKSSYIDSFLDRAVNATERATGINAALHGDTKDKWFID